MNNELAKQLKDAGFPNMHQHCTKGQKGEHDCRADKPDCTISFLVTPTLEELIDALNPFSPDEFVLNTYLDYWEAYWLNNSARVEDDKRIKTTGTSPTEAVARLWIALNTPIKHDHEKEAN